MSRPFRTKNLLHYILFNKPYGVLSQFTSEGGLRSLREFGPFPSDIYPVGRLDADSEGLILLTNDDFVKHRLTDPKFGHPRTYLAQVENRPEEMELEMIREGIILGGKQTMPAEVTLLSSDPMLPTRTVPIRFRKNVPTFWVELTLHEGKNRQVRRMTAAIGHPTLRLVRTKISFLSLTGLQQGEHRELTKEEIEKLRDILSNKPIVD
jgi:23S rRNA pseudouridine2457 synthase